MEIKNTKEAEKFFNKISSAAESINMYWSIVFFRSPITNYVEVRTIMSDSIGEVSVWADNCKNFYTNMGYPFVAYLDGHIHSRSNESVFF